MRNWTIHLLTIALLLVGGAAVAADNPWHNTANPYDVDNNGKISPRDFQLIVNQLQSHSGESAAPLTASEGGSSFYWDTSNDLKVTPYDGLLVVNQLLAAPAPEPSTLISAGVGLATLAGLCWRRRRRQ